MSADTNNESLSQATAGAKHTRGPWLINVANRITVKSDSGSGGDKQRIVYTLATCSTFEEEMSNAVLAVYGPDMRAMIAEFVELSTPCHSATPEAWKQRREKTATLPSRARLLLSQIDDWQKSAAESNEVPA